jgi:hypothetical protein
MRQYEMLCANFPRLGSARTLGRFSRRASAEHSGWERAAHSAARPPIIRCSLWIIDGCHRDSEKSIAIIQIKTPLLRRAGFYF